MGTHPCIKALVPARNRGRPEALLLPEACTVVEVLVAAPDVVHQDVQPPLLGLDAVKQRPHLVVVGVVAGHGDPCAAGLRNGRGDLLQRAAQTAGACARLHGAARYVNRGAGFTQAESDTLADAAEAPVTRATRPLRVLGNWYTGKLRS